jgi:RNA polymerase sigma-70 factor (ECF subfamily)
LRSSIARAPTPLDLQLYASGDDDAALVVSARANPQTFTLLYDRHVTRVHNYCYARLGSREAAEDATSEVFLKALAELGSFRGGFFAAWLFRIAQRTVVDQQRHNQRGPRLLPLVAADAIADSAPTPGERVESASDITAVWAALQHLPADQRAVVELDLAELSPQEIAATLGRSLNAVRLLRFRAFRRLRPLLAETSLDRHDHEMRGERPC